MPNVSYEVFNSINEVDRNKWDNVIECSKTSSFFQSYAWQQVMEEGGWLEPRHIVSIKNENFISIFPNYITKVRNTPLKRLFSIHPGYGGPVILSSDEKEILNGMFDVIPRLCRGSVYSHYISPYNDYYIGYGSFLRSRGYAPQLGCRFVIDLSKGIEDIRNGMTHQKRRNIKKCGDVEVIDKKINEESLLEFHSHFSSLMKDIGAPSYPAEFFTSMQRYIPDNVKIFEAVCEGDASGQIMFFLDPCQNTVHKFFSGVEKRHLKSGASPYDIIIWRTLNWAKEEGFGYYDFGQTDDDFCNGVFRHKMGFGGQIVPMIMWERVFSKARWKIIDVLKSVHQRL